MQYDFNIDLKDLDGNTVKSLDGQPETAGKLLARSLANQSKGDALKLFGWAQKMWKAEKINLDKSDQKLLREFIENNEQITILAKAQLLDILEKKESE